MFHMRSALILSLCRELTPQQALQLRRGNHLHPLTVQVRESWALNLAGHDCTTSHSLQTVWHFRSPRPPFCPCLCGVLETGRSELRAQLPEDAVSCWMLYCRIDRERNITHTRDRGNVTSHFPLWNIGRDEHVPTHAEVELVFSVNSAQWTDQLVSGKNI
jgi:hypothetical protein